MLHIRALELVGRQGPGNDGGQSALAPGASALASAMTHALCAGCRICARMICRDDRQRHGNDRPGALDQPEPCHRLGQSSGLAMLLGQHEVAIEHLSSARSPEPARSGYLLRRSDDGVRPFLSRRALRRTAACGHPMRLTHRRITWWLSARWPVAQRARRARSTKRGNSWREYGQLIPEMRISIAQGLHLRTVDRRTCEMTIEGLRLAGLPE